MSDQSAAGVANWASKGSIQRFFARKYLQLLRSALTPSERTKRYDRDADVLEVSSLLEQQLSARENAPRRGEVPKVIWMLWQQGWDEAPDVVRSCADSFARCNPGWDVRLIGETDIAKLAPRYAEVKAPEKLRTATSNMARLALLEAQGGVWADATLFCQRPLDDWLPGFVQSGFFVFHKPRPYRQSDIWFLAASKGTPVVSRWFDLARTYWSCFSFPHHYYWLEYLFELLIENDPEVAHVWDETPRLTGLAPLLVGRNPFAESPPQALADLLADKKVPVHKLSHKWKAPANEVKGCAYHLLTGNLHYA